MQWEKGNRAGSSGSPLEEEAALSKLARTCSLSQCITGNNGSYVARFTYGRCQLIEYSYSEEI